MPVNVRTRTRALIKYIHQLMGLAPINQFKENICYYKNTNNPYFENYIAPFFIEHLWITTLLLLFIKI